MTNESGVQMEHKFEAMPGHPSTCWTCRIAKHLHVDIPDTGAIELAVQGEVRIVKARYIYGTWKRITSLSANFVCLDGGPASSRRALENMLASGRVEYRPADWASL